MKRYIIPTKSKSVAFFEFNQDDDTPGLRIGFDGLPQGDNTPTVSWLEAWRVMQDKGHGWKEAEATVAFRRLK